MSVVAPTVSVVTQTGNTPPAAHPAPVPPAAEPAVGVRPDDDSAPEPGGADESAAPRRPALSPSRAADFKLCPLLYRFRAIDRLPEVPSPAQARGTLVHAVLERLYALPAAQRVPAAARELLASIWAELCAADPRLPGALTGSTGAEADGSPGVVDVDAWLADAGPLLDAYFALEDPRLHEPEARELLVEVELESGLLLRGYVDRVDRVAAGEGGEQIHVVDYKTGTAPRPVAEARALFQLKFYALVLLCLRGVAPRELRLLYLTGPEVLTYVPDEVQLRRFARTLEAIWAAIRTAGATGDFRPNPGPACSWCSHRALCPAWDGVPPPYPGWPGDAAVNEEVVPEPLG
jgi:putative RecB family exonuclease